MASESSQANTRRVPSPSPSGTSSQFTCSTSQSFSHTPMEALQKSLISGKFSDLTIIHGTRKWNAHKVVVCSQSRHLEFLMENKTDPPIIRLTQYDHEAVALMMEYLYTSNYTTYPSEPDYCLPLHEKIYVLASELEITGLQTLAISYFRYNLNTHVTNLDVYFTSVIDVYASTSASNPGLRLALVEAAISEMHKILNEAPVKKRFHEVTAKVPEFQEEIFRLLVANPTRPVQFVIQELCEECGPRPEKDNYEVTLTCKGCGEERTLEFS